jgi:hypothetical protein
MTEKRLGINIIRSNNLPVEFLNEKTGETEISHMIQIGNEIYVSEELFRGLKEEFER